MLITSSDLIFYFGVPVCTYLLMYRGGPQVEKSFPRFAFF